MAVKSFSTYNKTYQDAHLANNLTYSLNDNILTLELIANDGTTKLSTCNISLSWDNIGDKPTSVDGNYSESVDIISGNSGNISDDLIGKDVTSQTTDSDVGKVLAIVQEGDKRVIRLVSLS